MKAFIDLLTEEQDCLRNIKMADEAIVTLNNIRKRPWTYIYSRQNAALLHQQNHRAGFRTPQNPS